MSDISRIDDNLRVAAATNEPDRIYYDVKEEPFRIYGLYSEKSDKRFLRLPEAIAKATSVKVEQLNHHTAGGRVRFKTNSRYIALKAVMPGVNAMPHMTLAGSSGFDLYVNEKGISAFYKTFIPPVGMKNGYESVISFNDDRERDLTINFPLYNGVSSLSIGLQQTASVAEGDLYRYQAPVLYYGSSITQGGCASRPGNSYSAIISRLLDCDYLNLGFSGSALGEVAIVEYMAQLPISVFVCDYDHNAPSVTHLQATHERLYQTIRSKNKDLAILLVSRPDFAADSPDCIQRRDVVYNTYRNAVNNGDRKVFYIDGELLFGTEHRDSCTVDGVHPNDLGFMRMAEKIGGVIKQIFG